MKKRKMAKLFNKAALFTDIHFGKKNNNREYNEYCDKFIDWFIDISRSKGCDVCIFLGDWHDNRRTINISTLNFSLENIEKLSKNFDQIFMIVGNHDLYYREKRDLNSINFSRNIKNVKIINEITIIDDCCFLPWLMDYEIDQVKKISKKYVFSHLELPFFILNNNRLMEDNGKLRLEDLKNNDMVLTGHFHKRQQKDNVYYIGNAFPQNFSDSGDLERGMAILEWGGDLEYYTWPDQPVFFQIRLDELENYYGLINDKCYIKLIINDEYSFEEIKKKKDTLYEKFKVKEISILYDLRKLSDYNVDTGSINTNLKTVSEIIIDSIKSISEMSEENKQLMIEIFNDLDIDSYSD